MKVFFSYKLKVPHFFPVQFSKEGRRIQKRSIVWDSDGFMFMPNAPWSRLLGLLFWPLQLSEIFRVIFGSRLVAQLILSCLLLGDCECCFVCLGERNWGWLGWWGFKYIEYREAI